MDDDKKAQAQKVYDAGGFVAEESGDDSVRFQLAIDPKNPRQIFDRLDVFELDLIRQANGDLEKIKKASDLVDTLRTRVIEALESVNVDTTNLFLDSNSN